MRPIDDSSAPPCAPTPVRISIETLRFSDGTTVTLDPEDTVIFVGPNNSGKSAALRAIRGKVADRAYVSPVVDSLSVSTSGSAQDVLSFLEATARVNLESSPSNPSYHAYGAALHRSQVQPYWTTGALSTLTRFFCHLLTAEERLQAANPAPAIALVRDPSSHPIHVLQRNDGLEQLLSDAFRKAFGTDLVLHRNAGNQVPFYVGQRPVPAAGQDRLSYDYLLAVEQLAPLQTQGDGMRSFAGVLLHTAVGHETILLIDEPEAFLHPPQARYLGRVLVRPDVPGRQLFVATHSGDLLRGMLDGNASAVRVVRLQREGAINRVSQLDKESIALLWSDPLLRYSNVLDGIFHELVVVTESDSDSRFYAAIAEAIADRDTQAARPPDTMFTHGGGKARLPLIVRSLRGVGVPVRAVADFDILNDENPLADLVAAAGGDWAALKGDWLVVKDSIDAMKPELSTSEVAKEITSVVSAITDAIFPKDAKRQIERILRRSSPWSRAKSIGVSFVPNGTPSQACSRLLASLRALGLFVLEVGELEGFVREVGGHGPTWVNEVLKRNLKVDPDLSAARGFVGRVLGGEAR